ncbi:hypothetical protein TNCV_1624891 [Trichonephila clavipes]|nr:hypothetical protein TNCV_1624891 [Trichonephila clavipes]
MQNNKFWKGFGASLRVGGLTTMCWVGDFKRTSLAGLAPDSATSSGLGRAPRSAMQDPIQAPTGATRQARLYTS